MSIESALAQTKMKTLATQAQQLKKINDALDFITESCEQAASVIRTKKIAMTDANIGDGLDDYQKSMVQSVMAWREEKDKFESSRKRINMADPSVQPAPSGLTSLGLISTAISKAFYQMPMGSINENPIVNNVNVDYFEGVSQYVPPAEGAMAGLAGGGLRGAQPESINVPTYNLSTVTPGFFGARVSLDANKLMWERAIESTDGWYAQRAMARAIANCALVMGQRQSHMIVRTQSDDYYTYYVNPENVSAVNVITYGRLDRNVFTPTVPWAVAGGGTGANKYVPNPSPDNKPIQYLTSLFSAAIPVINTTRGSLIAIAMNPITASIITLTAQKEGAVADAIGTSIAFKQNTDWSAPNVISLNVPALAGIDIFVDHSTLLTGVDPVYGVISSNEYLIPDGVILPVFDAQGGKAANGTLVFSRDPRGAVYGSAPMPSGILQHSNPNACYMNIRSSSNIPGSESLFWSVELGARMAYYNQLAAGYSYIIKAFDPIAIARDNDIVRSAKNIESIRKMREENEKKKSDIDESLNVAIKSEVAKQKASSDTK